MKVMKRQDGVTPITVTLGVLLAGIAIMLVFKLVPVYMENFGVVSSLKSLEEEGGMHKRPKAELLKFLQRRLDINDVRRVQTEDITINKRPRETTIRVEYEVVVPLISNIDFLLTFDQVATLN